MTDGPYGLLRTTQVHDGARVLLYIDLADPRIIISGQIVDAARSGGSPWMKMDGDDLTIRAENRTVTYRLGERLAGPDSYAAGMVTG